MAKKVLPGGVFTKVRETKGNGRNFSRKRSMEGQEQEASCDNHQLEIKLKSLEIWD